MFGMYADSSADSTWLGSTPSSSAPAVRPARPSSLNELSSKPPASDTMQGTKSLAAPPVASPVGSSPASGGGAAQPASSRALAPSVARPATVFREVILKMSSKMLPGRRPGPLRYTLPREIGRNRAHERLRPNGYQSAIRPISRRNTSQPG